MQRILGNTFTPAILALALALVLVYFSTMGCWETYHYQATFSTIYPLILMSMKLSVLFGGLILILQFISKRIFTPTQPVGVDQSGSSSILKRSESGSTYTSIILLVFFTPLYISSLDDLPLYFCRTGHAPPLFLSTNKPIFTILNEIIGLEQI